MYRNSFAKQQCMARRCRSPSFLVVLATLGCTAAFAQTPDTAVSASIEEVVVTARKFEEGAQTVPMSLQVLSGGLLDDLDLTDLYELQFEVPGLVVNNVGAFGAGFALRGISNQGGTSLSVASHLNGVYLGNANLAITRMFDLERIEVLKGPQGTLYGRNATGGSINFITRTPQDEFSASMEAAFGSFETRRVQGHVNLPFENAALRLAFIGSASDGFIRNSVDARRFSENDFRGIRGSWRIDPVEKLRVTLMAQRVVDDGASGELWLPNPAFIPDPSDIQLTTVTLADPFLKTRNDNASLDLEYDLGFATLRSLTGYARSHVDDRDDCAGLPFLRGCVREILPLKHRQWSQELQLVSPGGGRADWIAGANYFSADGSRHYYLSTPLLNPLPTNDTDSTSEDDAYAAFGQLTLRLAQAWRMTGGLRLSHERRKVTDIGNGTADNATLTAAANHWNHLSWRVDLAYAAREETLYYASIATGFKSGGITTERLPDGEFDDFDSENLTAYEAGVKAQWLDRRLTVNAAAFFYDFKDLQVTTTYFDGATVVTATDNAAQAEIYGIDAATSLQLSNRWTISAGAVWMPKREFVDFKDQPGANLSGNRISRAPQWTTTSAINYRVPLRGLGDVSVRLEYNYRSGYFFTKDNEAIFSQGSFGLLNLSMRFESLNQTWYAFASGRNLTNEDYFTQVFIQSSPGYPDTYEIGLGLRL